MVRTRATIPVSESRAASSDALVSPASTSRAITSSEPSTSASTGITAEERQTIAELGPVLNEFRQGMAILQNSVDEMRTLHAAREDVAEPASVNQSDNPHRAASVSTDSEDSDDEESPNPFSRHLDRNLSFPPKLKITATYQERDHWARQMEDVFEAAPFRYYPQRYRVLAAIHDMEDDVRNQWDGYLADQPASTAKEASHTWIGFREWLDKIGPEAGDSLLSATLQYLAPLSTTMSPQKLRSHQRTLEGKMDPVSESMKIARFLSGLSPDLRSQLSVAGYNSRSKMSDILERADSIWRAQKALRPTNTQPEKRSAPDAGQSQPNKKQKTGTSQHTQSNGQSNRREGHKSKLHDSKNPRTGTSNQVVPSTITCFHCGESGHYSTTCPDKAAGKPASVVVHAVKKVDVDQDKGKGKAKAD